MTIKSKMQTWMWRVEGSLLCREGRGSGPKKGSDDNHRAPRLSLCPLSISGLSFGRSGPGLCNRQESYPAGEIAGAGGAPAFPESRNQVGRSTDRRTPTENTGGRG